ncbi:MAG: hypothetical protein V4677_15815 [Bacteroidota bacterium]
MKKLLFTLFTFSAFVAFSQAPQKISYQGVARNVSGTALASQPIGLKFVISNGVGPVYEETHPVNTNAFGLFTVFIGGGTPTLGSFSSINWSTGTYFLEVLIDPAGGTSYASVGTQQFMSVPYALYAQTSGNASPTPTININLPNTVTGSGGNYNITVSSQTLSISGNQVSISNGNTITLPVPPVYTAGPGIDINGSGVISNTLTPVTPTITGIGIANVTPTSGNNFTVSVAQPTLSYNNSTNVLSLTHDGTTVTTATLAGTGTNTTSIVGSGLATVTPTTGSSFTVSVPNPTLTLGAGSLSISNGNSVILPTQSLSINSNLLSISGPGGNTVSLPATSISGIATGITTTTVSGNTFTVNTPMPIYTAGTGVLSFGGTNTVVATPSLSIAGNVLRSGPASNTVTIPGGSITGMGTGIASVTTSVNNFTVNVPTPTYNTATGILAFGTNTLNAAPTLSLTGSTLSSGTNSVNLATLPGLWTAPTATVVALSTASNFVGIGTNTPVHKLDVAFSSTATAAIRGRNSGTGTASTGVFGENLNNGIGVYGESNSGQGIWGKSTSDAGVYGESVSGNAGKFLMTGNGSSFGVQVQTNGTGAALYAKTNNTTAAALAAKIEGNVDIQNPGSTSGKLINAVQTNSVSDGFSLDVNNVNNVGNALQVRHFGSGKAGYFEVSNSGNGGPAVEVLNNGTASSIRAVNSNTASAGAHAIVAQAASGAALSATSSGSLVSTIYATNSGAGDVIYANANDGIAFYGANTSSSSKSVMELASNGDGIALQVYKNSGATGYVASFLNSSTVNPSNAVIVSSTGAAHSLYSANSNASFNAFAGLFDGGLVSKGKTNTSAAFSFKAFDNSGTELFGVRNDGHVGVNATSPAHRLTVVEPSAANAAIFASNVSAAANASAHGIMGLTSNSHILAAAVFGQNSGSGPSIFGVKSPSETGIAGRFELQNTSNSADAVFAKTDGSGAAVHAVSSTTTNMVSTLALWVENGHIKSTGSVPTASTVSNSTSFSGASYTLNSATDVKGNLLAVCTTTSGLSIYAGSTITFRVSFSKAYQVAPTVVITPIQDMNGLSYFVSGTNTTSFTITIRNSAAGTIAVPNLSFGFNYMVIE